MQILSEYKWGPITWVVYFLGKCPNHRLKGKSGLFLFSAMKILGLVPIAGQAYFATQLFSQSSALLNISSGLAYTELNHYTQVPKISSVEHKENWIWSIGAF